MTETGQSRGRKDHCACALLPLRERLSLPEKFVLDDLPSVSKTTRESPGNSTWPVPVSQPSPAMAAASPSVFLLMVTGQVESAQVSSRGPRLGTARSSPPALPSALGEPSLCSERLK